MSTSIWSAIASALRLLVRPIAVSARGGPEAINQLWTQATGESGDQFVIDTLEAFGRAAATIRPDNWRDIERPQDITQRIGPVLNDLSRLITTVGDAAPLLLEYLALRFLWNASPITYSTLALVDVINEARQPGMRCNWNEISNLFDPAAMMRKVYGWGGASPESAFDAEEFLRRCANLLASCGAPVEFKSVDAQSWALVDPTAGGAGQHAPAILIAPILRRVSNGGYISVGVAATPIGESGPPSERGLAVFPFGTSSFSNGELGQGWTIEINGRVDGHAVIFRPNRTTVQKIDPLAEDSIRLRAVAKRMGPWQLSLGGGFVVGSDTIELAVESQLGQSFFAKYSVAGLTIRIGGTDSDGFLAKVLPKGGLTATADFALTWSSATGLVIEAGLGFETTIPLHLNLGPVTLSNLGLGLYLSDSPILSIHARIDVAAKIGPIQVMIAGVGVRGVCDQASKDDAHEDGSFGPVHVDIGFLAPSGAGLAIDAGGVSGGGFLQRREERSQYDGILHLRFGEIGLVAIGLLTTRLPGGTDGYALFINIGVTFSPAITLPYNFTLQGCGGLLAINRTMDVEALRTGLRNKTLDSILFPEDPILSATKIINDSERVFPIEEGRFIVAPMGKLGWGANGLIVADVAIILELPAPIIIALLGQITAKVPKSDEAKVIMHLDVLGVLDIAKKTLGIDATLYDSRIIKYELYGDAALRLSWGSKPVFAMSVGGFHPKFTPPPDFPKLRRLTLELSSSSSFELTCRVYQALTSNTLQLGAKIQLYAEACGAEVNGHLSFDGMITFSPFGFDIGISGSVSASYKGHDICSVGLSVDLSGPTPWHAKGRAKISVLCWDVTARFNKTWGNDDKARLAKVDPRDDFLTEIALVSNWGSGAIPRRTVVESLKSLEAGSATTQADVLAHPAGGLEVRQRLLPMGITLDLFGNAEVKDHDRFDMTLELGPADAPLTTGEGGELDNVPVKEHFARGQFKSLSKSERLSKPSYEQFKAGVHVRPRLARLDGIEQQVPLEYDSSIIQRDGARPASTVTIPNWSTSKRAIQIAALQRAAARHRGLGKFLTDRAPRVGLDEEAFTIVDKATLTRATAIHPESSPPLTQTEAEEIMEAAIADKRVAAGSVMVVPEFEVEPA